MYKLFGLRPHLKKVWVALKDGFKVMRVAESCSILEKPYIWTTLSIPRR